ncbi:MAG TPA: alpha/beta hydrolase [Methylomirabilota bacterium]|jgi:pimeloyl-ACP methyl ester carboxylesterase|nr:alpha/beta hydrolase [Methylomirabilota bacterium]
MPYINRGGVSTYYETYGKGFPIVFLHPFSTNGYIWTFQTFSFARTNQCVVIDERGHGRSDKPQQGYAIKEIAADVVAVLDALKINTAVLVGNSIGGMIAMQLNLDAPDRVAGNVILSSGTNLGAGMPPEAAQAFQKDLVGAFSGLVDNAIAARTKRERPEVVDMIKSVFLVEENFPHYVFFASASDPAGVFNWNISDRLKDIKKPTLVLAGEEDQATPVAANKFLADNIPGAQLKVFKDVGHFFQIERPHEFNAELQQFLKQVTA